MELGEKIQLSRKKKGMSQEDLANVLDVSRQAVQKWESGAAKPELSKAIELGRVLDVSLDWLLSEGESKADTTVEEETEPVTEEAPVFEEETEPVASKDNLVLEKPKHSFKKVFIIDSIALLLVGGGAAAAIIIGMNANKAPVDMLFEKGSQSFVVEGYEKTEVIDGVSYALGKMGEDKSMYIVGVETPNPSFLGEYKGYVLEDMLFGTFSARRDYVSVTLPDHWLFETVNSSTVSFKGCTKLEEVKLPDGLLTLGDFGGCTSLSEIALPDTLEEIEPEAFRGCNSLSKITLPNSLRSLGKYAFMSCSSLENITFEGTVKKWESITKGALIWDSVPADVVHCSNGDVPLDK